MCSHQQGIVGLIPLGGPGTPATVGAGAGSPRRADEGEDHDDEGGGRRTAGMPSRSATATRQGKKGMASGRKELKTYAESLRAGQSVFINGCLGGVGLSREG
jgi:hypothetical protein